MSHGHFLLLDRLHDYTGRAEHIVATAVKLGRLKDWARIEAFLNQKAVDLTALRDVLERHALMDAWKNFCLKSGIKDPLAVG